jgi:hypothetical protein
MDTQGSIELRELNRVGVTCKCGIETIFDVRKELGAANVRCPCGEQVLRVQAQENLDFNWVTLYKMFYSGSEREKDSPRIRFYVSV